MMLRVLRYARESLSKAERQLADLSQIWQQLEDIAENTDQIYRSAIVHGDQCVPIDFMRFDNEFRRLRMRIDETQSKVLVNLSLTLSYCSQLLDYTIEHPQGSSLHYRYEIRQLIGRSADIATNRAMFRSSLSNIAILVAQMESKILLNSMKELEPIRNSLFHFRLKIT